MQVERSWKDGDYVLDFEMRAGGLGVWLLNGGEIYSKRFEPGESIYVFAGCRNFHVVVWAGEVPR